MHFTAKANLTGQNNDIIRINKAASILRNELYLRQAFMRQHGRKKRDIYAECHYPKYIDTDMYRDMFDRFGPAARVVKLEPIESWGDMPKIYENKDDTQTEFEQIWEYLELMQDVWGELLNADILSGIGHYGIMLIGYDDGKDLSEPVEGFNEDEEIGTKAISRRVLYLRSFDEKLAPVIEWETNKQSPRYGEPVKYNVTFVDPDLPLGASQGSTSAGLSSVNTPVHWHRVVHFADNTLSNKQLGIPRQKDVFNLLLDLFKVAAADGEGMWKAGVPGLFFEGDAEFDVDFDTDSILEEVSRYDNGLQRYMAMQGVRPHKLDVNLVDPDPHMMLQLKLISMAKGIPMRKLLGSEQGELASSQDDKSWNKKLTSRRKRYLNPKVILRLVQHLQRAGVLPTTAKPLVIEWEDIDQPTSTEIATKANQITEALAKYIAGNVDTLIQPKQYLVNVLGWEEELVDAVLEESSDAIGDEDSNNPLEARRATAKAELDAQFAAQGIGDGDGGQDGEDTPQDTPQDEEA